MIGYCICGSFCTHKKSLEILSKLTENYEVQPILSETAYSTNTRFGYAESLIKNVKQITGSDIIHSVKDAEPLGPALPLDFMVISPCTGNTLAKIANGITDTSVTMAAKAHLRSNRPLLISLASNDALSANLCNISLLLNRKNIYFVPMVQDDPVSKPHSLVADFDMIFNSIEKMKSGEQIRPLFR